MVASVVVLVVGVVLIGATWWLGSTLPDLQAQLLASAPAQVRAGDPLTVTDTTFNRGGSLAPSSTTRFYLSQHRRQPTIGLPPLGERRVPALPPGASSTATTRLEVPPTFPPGTYDLLACVDDRHEVREILRRNNCALGPDPVTITPS